MSQIAQRKELAYRCLIDAARSLSGALDVDELVGHILLESQEVMQCGACSVSLPEEGTGDLIIRGTQPELKGQILRVPAGKGIAGRVFRTRRLENLGNAQTDAEHYRMIGKETNTPAGAMLTIPLLDGETCHGVMQALNPIDRDRFDQLDEEIFLAFGSLIATTLTRMRAEEGAREEEIREAYRQAELSVARKVQFSFMPSAYFASGQLQARVFQEQAGDVGGDFYAYHEIPDGNVLFAVGDASGKGVPAALEAARVCTLISLKAASCSAERLAVWLGELNEVLWKSALESDSLATLAILLVDSKRRRLYACTFGQPRPFLRSFDGPWEELECEVYPSLGVLQSVEFPPTCVPLAMASQWLLFTDGFAEARNSAGHFFRDHNLRETLGSAVEQELDVLQSLELSWRDFIRDGADRDDATALLVNHSEASPIHSFDGMLTLETIASIRSLCQDWAAYCGLGQESVYQSVLACDEILTNIYKHAYHGVGGPLSWKAGVRQNEIWFCFNHRGDGITSIPQGAPSEAQPGGYGLPFIEQVFDDVALEHDREGFHVVLRKKIDFL